jgi:hypothetical protein
VVVVAEVNVGRRCFTLLSLAAILLLCAAPVRAGLLFFDGFSGSSLDTSKWSVVSGSPIVSGGLLDLGLYDRDRINSLNTFSPGGQTLSLRASIDLTGDYEKFGFNVNGDAGTIAYYFDTYDNRFGANTDKVRALVLQSGVGELMNTGVDVTWYTFHTLGIDWSANGVSFLIDGTSVASYAYSFNSALPIGDWSDTGYVSSTDWVELDSVPEPGTFVLLAPLAAVVALLRRNRV